MSKSNDTRPLIAHLSDPIELAPQPAKPTPQPKHVCTPLGLNKNLMNYPLARSARTQPVWHEDKAESWCTLPGEDRIKLSIPADASAGVRQHPTGFDMNILFVLLAAAQQSKKERVEFASLAAFLRELHLTAERDSRDRVAASMELWAALTICHSHWYEHVAHVEHERIDGPLPEPERGEHVVRNLPPPVRRVDFRGQRIIVTLDEAWVRLACKKQYFESIPLPLPQDSSVQNYALLALTSTHPIWRRAFCRKIGLRNARQKLERIGVLVNRWFEARGGWLMVLESGGIKPGIKPGQIEFAFKPPAVPRSKSRGVEGSKSTQTGGSKVQNPPKQGGRRFLITKDPYGELREERINEPAKPQATDCFTEAGDKKHPSKQTAATPANNFDPADGFEGWGDDRLDEIERERLLCKYAAPDEDLSDEELLSLESEDRRRRERDRAENLVWAKKQRR